MAWDEYYVDLDIGGTGGAGTSGDPYRSMDELKTVLEAASPTVATRYWITGTDILSSDWSPAILNANSVPIELIGYGTTPGDNGRFVVGSHTLSDGNFRINLSSTYSKCLRLFNMEHRSFSRGPAIASHPFGVIANCLFAAPPSSGSFSCSFTSGMLLGCIFRNAIVTAESAYVGCCHLEWDYSHTTSYALAAGLAERCTVNVNGGTMAGIRVDCSQFQRPRIGVVNCSVYNVNGPGIEFVDTNPGGNGVNVNVDRNIIYDADVGIAARSGDDGQICTIGTNAIGAVTTSQYANITEAVYGRETISLTADPFVDAANNDFRLNAAAGGGALCRGVGMGNLLSGMGLQRVASYYSGLDLGAMQTDAGSASSQPPFRMAVGG